MKVDLSKYRGMNICVAVSGGRDSMALLHFLIAHGKEFGINVSAVNCNHNMRGENSARDSAFVAEYCKRHGISLNFYEWNEDVKKTETSAREWRRACYFDAAAKADAAIATAHHLNDNAETVLFNLARGSGLSGLTGIGDVEYTSDGRRLKIIRPLIGCSREEIEDYIAQNGIPFVDDETNFTDDYTRNKIRHNVLPELEKAVGGAAKAIYRFSRIAAEDEQYFEDLIAQRGLVRHTPLGCEIAYCPEKPVFNRAVLQALKGVKDYTSEHLDRLYDLQFAEKGKKFEFLGLTAYSENGKIAICVDFSEDNAAKEASFSQYVSTNFCGQTLYIGLDNFSDLAENLKILRFDLDKIPQAAVVRFMREGDKFKKFGGGTKNLGYYFTDKKIPVRIRKSIPVIADGNQILVVCGVEISDSVKVDGSTKRVAFCVAEDYLQL